MGVGELLTLIIAVAGLMLGIVNSSVQWRSWRADRAKVRVTVSVGRIIERGGAGKGPFLFVQAVNEGRRPVMLRAGGLLLGRPNPLARTLDRVRHRDPLDDRLVFVTPTEVPLPKLLGEGEYHQVQAYVSAYTEWVASHPRQAAIGAYYDDATGRRWKGRLDRRTAGYLRRRIAESVVGRPEETDRSASRR